MARRFATRIGATRRKNPILITVWGDSRESPQTCFVRSFEPPEARFAKKKGFSSGTLKRFARIRRFARICESIRANRANTLVLLRLAVAHLSGNWMHAEVQPQVLHSTSLLGVLSASSVGYGMECIWSTLELSKLSLANRLAFKGRNHWKSLESPCP